MKEDLGEVTMPRQDVPYGGAICRLRERIAEIFDKLGEKLHTINGVPGDGTETSRS